MLLGHTFTLLQPLRQCFAFDKLHHDEGFSFGLLDSIDRGDIRTIEFNRCYAEPS